MSEITAIIGAFKRDTIPKLLYAVKNQTVKPKEIYVWKNSAEEFHTVGNSEFCPEDAWIRWIRSSQNLGVWARFIFALNFKTEYIAIFDDDTIPGPLWFENCIDTMLKTPAILGTVGLEFTGYDYMNHNRYGWPNPNREAVQVDLVGHAWFFKREWLASMFLDSAPPGYDLVGEDMHLSYAAQKYHGIPTIVPPHPPENKDMWGSTDGEALGTDDASIWLTYPEAHSKMTSYYQRLKRLGWKTKNGA